MTGPPTDRRLQERTGADPRAGARDALAEGALAHALHVLEFHEVLDAVARRASCELGRERVRSLEPRTDIEGARRELARVGAAMRFVDEDPSWGMPPVPDVRAALAEVGTEGAVLEPVALHRIGVLLGSSSRLGAEFAGRAERYEELSSVTERLVEDSGSEGAIERCVDADGQVRDGASTDLKKIRSRLRGANARIVRKLESFMASLPERFVVPDASVTIREGRYVVPIRREGKREVGGIVHDESHTGVTLFVEPPVAIGLMNELRDLEREEAREIRRILGELSARLSPLSDALMGALDALADFDALVARGRTALAWSAAVPELVEPAGGELTISEGRHPLLVELADHPVVPFDLEVSTGERAVVVSGPNTGGKSVFLKAIGLIATLAQSGVVPPVGPGTRIPVFASVFADIGDEQSISQSLSTFSAHLANLGEIVRLAGPDSLVLIDEMGTGTDPAEGAALARAILGELVDRGALTLVSSHLGELKRLDIEGSGIVNASLQFDPERMEPTYRLVKGRPGRSYGLAIARRLGFPSGVLDAAVEFRDEGEARMEELLARLELQEREADELIRSLGEERTLAERLRDDVETREASLREAERDADGRAREQARRLLLQARAEVEDTIREVRSAADAGADLDTAARGARRRVEDAVHRQSSPPRGRSRSAPELRVGDSVRVLETGARGRVTELRAGRAIVEAGMLRLELPQSDLERDTDPGTERTAERSGGWKGSVGGQARTEIDLRGLRVDEMELELARAMDQAVFEDLSELRIIHGKGTGALRQRVDELLQKDGRVRDHRMGSPGEGGAGVTVVSFKVER